MFPIASDRFPEFRIGRGLSPDACDVLGEKAQQSRLFHRIARCMKSFQDDLGWAPPGKSCQSSLEGLAFIGRPLGASVDSGEGVDSFGTAKHPSDPRELRGRGGGWKSVLRPQVRVVGRDGIIGREGKRITNADIVAACEFFDPMSKFVKEASHERGFAIGPCQS